MSEDCACAINAFHLPDTFDSAAMFLSACCRFIRSL